MAALLATSGALAPAGFFASVLILARFNSSLSFGSCAGGGVCVAWRAPAVFASASTFGLADGRAIFEAAAGFAVPLAGGAAADRLAPLAAVFALAAFSLATKAAFSCLVRGLLALLLRAAEFLALLAAVLTVRLGILEPRFDGFLAVFFRAAITVLLQLSKSR